MMHTSTTTLNSINSSLPIAELTSHPLSISHEQHNLSVDNNLSAYSLCNSKEMRSDLMSQHNYTSSHLLPAPFAFQQPLANNIRVSLDDQELWRQFYHITNEMILTKAGRRTFPLIKVRIQGLDDNELYTVQIEFRVADQFKYRFLNGEWKTSPRTEKCSGQAPVIHQHPDSPNFGHHWAKDSVGFGKLKLTNYENTKNPDAVYLKSLNKYLPIVHILKHDKKNVDDKVLIYSKPFVETEFIAVTAYQNENITNLKIKYNPFAKAFLNNKPTITIDSERKVIICDTAYDHKIQAPLSTTASHPAPRHHQKSTPNQQASAQSVLNTQTTPISANTPNWYNYYPIPQSQPVQFHHHQVHDIYQHQVHNADVAYSTANYPAYNRFFTPYQTGVYQQGEFLYHHPENQSSSSLIFDAGRELTSDVYQYNSSGKRAFKEERTMQEDEPSSRPAKRANMMGSLEISPVYSDYPSKSDLRHNDDSLTSNGDNYPSSSSDPLQQSANSSSSFTMSSSIVSS